MNYIIEFYKNLDTFNLVMFWSVIIIIILLLIFAIIITNKNRKLKHMLSTNARIESSELENNKNEYRDIPDDDIIVKREEENLELISEENGNEAVVEEDKFVPEEHVIAYDNSLFTLPNIEKNSPVEEERNVVELRPKTEVSKPVTVEPKPVIESKIDSKNLYQKNVFHSTYANQTSPIGITKVEETNKETKEARELNNTLNEETQSKTYLDEVARKLNDAKNNETLERTAYEIAEEENAIISYKELMKRKDELEMIDEEESVISIEELMQKKAKEKLYNITDKDTDDEFISELKNFRHDL